MNLCDNPAGLVVLIVAIENFSTSAWPFCKRFLGRGIVGCVGAGWLMGL
jgi:hypothetical protein